MYGPIVTRFLFLKIWCFFKIPPSLFLWKKQISSKVKDNGTTHTQRNLSYTLHLESQYIHHLSSFWLLECIQWGLHPSMKTTKMFFKKCDPFIADQKKRSELKIRTMKISQWMNLARIPYTIGKHWQRTLSIHTEISIRSPEKCSEIKDRDHANI